MNNLNQLPIPSFKRLTKLRYDCLNFSISKDETRRPLFNTINHNERLLALCSTNGYCATILKSQYDTELKDISINVKTYQKNLSNFPRIELFNLSDKKDLNSITVNFHKHLYTKNTKMPTRLYLSHEKGLSFEPSSDDILCLNAELIKPLIGHQFEVRYTSALKPIYVLLNKSSEADYMVIMPMKKD